MLQVEKPFDMMLSIIRHLTANGSCTKNASLSPFALEILSFQLTTAVGGNCYSRISTAVFGSEVERPDLIEAIRESKLSIQYMESLENVDFFTNTLVYLSRKYEMLEDYKRFISTLLNVRFRLVNLDDQELDLNKMVNEDLRPQCKRAISVKSKCQKFLLVNVTHLHAKFLNPVASSYQGKFKDSPVNYYIHQGNYKFCKKDTFYYFELPYNNEALNLCILFPTLNSSVQQVLAKLDFATMIKLFSSNNRQFIEAHLPPIKVDHQMDFVPTIRSLGHSILSDEMGAEFSRMVSNYQDLTLESALMDVHLDSGETAPPVLENLQTGVLNYEKVVCDRPFIYFVTCDTKKLATMVLFCGVFDYIEN